MKTKVVWLLSFCSLVVLFFAFRSLAPQKAQEKINIGMSLQEVVESLQAGVVEPYSCSWRIAGDERPTATRSCNPPDKKFLSRANSGYRVTVIFKGVGMDYDFEVEFDEGGKVKLVAGGSAR